MRLTTRGRYAVTAMLDLAIHGGEGPVALADIACRQGISLSYLEQLFSLLRRADLVLGTRGRGGGYSLGRPASEIAVADVIRAVDETVDATRCGGKENCQGTERCLTHDLWDDLSHRIYEFLSEIDLAQLVERRSVREVALRQQALLDSAPEGRREATAGAGVLKDAPPVPISAS